MKSQILVPVFNQSHTLEQSQIQIDLFKIYEQTDHFQTIVKECILIASGNDMSLALRCLVCMLVL